MDKYLSVYFRRINYLPTQSLLIGSRHVHVRNLWIIYNGYYSEKQFLYECEKEHKILINILTVKWFKSMSIEDKYRYGLTDAGHDSVEHFF